MSLAVNANVDVNDLLVEHNSDGSHKNVKNVAHGLLSARPASPAVGDMYRATDTHALYTCDTAGTWSIATTDQYVAVDVTDSTPAYLTTKAVAGVGISATILNPGGNEAIQFSQSQVGINRDIMEGRLTLSTGTPNPLADVLAAATLYYTPYTGNRVALYYPTAVGNAPIGWASMAFTERSLSLASLTKGIIYDIFLYDATGTSLAPGTLTLEAVAWKKVTATGTYTAGAGKVITVADTSTLAVGQNVVIKAGATSEIAVITALVANTSITVTLVNGYTTPDIYGYHARATALVTQDGINCKTGSLDRRYIGTIQMTATDGQCEQSVKFQGVYNAYNQIRRLLKFGVTGVFGGATSTTRAANANTTLGQGRAQIVFGLLGSIIEGGGTWKGNSPSTNSSSDYLALAVNSTTAADSDCTYQTAPNTITPQELFPVAIASRNAVLGENFVQWIDSSDAWGGVSVSSGPTFLGYVLM